MAAKRMIARENRRISYSARIKNREALKAIISNHESTPQEVMTAVLKSQKRKVDESPVRRTNRCLTCGRPRGVFKKFGLCRCCLRKNALFGFVPGLMKSSW